MAKTDHPLKRLILIAITELASWILGSDVHSVVPVSIEHIATPDPIRSDLVFRVTLADGRKVLMPIEFQGTSNHKPVHLRLLDYVSRIVINERPNSIEKTITEISDYSTLRSVFTVALRAASFDEFQQAVAQVCTTHGSIEH